MWHAVVTFVDLHNLEIVIMFFFHIITHSKHYVLVPESLKLIKYSQRYCQLLCTHTSLFLVIPSVHLLPKNAPLKIIDATPPGVVLQGSYYNSFNWNHGYFWCWDKSFVMRLLGIRSFTILLQHKIWLFCLHIWICWSSKEVQICFHLLW